MSKKCPACGSDIVRPSRFQDDEERERYPSQSPFRCLACGARFFVTSHKTRQIVLGLLVVIPIAYAAVSWLLPPAAITKRSKLPNSAESPNSPNSLNAPTSLEAKAKAVAELAKESRCSSPPVNVVGETYKCVTQSGLTFYFVAPEVKASVQGAIPSPGSATETLDRGGTPQQ